MQHPSTCLKPEWVHIIRQNVSAAEQSGKLHPAQLALVHQQKWFQFLVPQVYGGLQLDLPAQARLEEALAWANGSLGWVVTLCSGAGWFGGFMDTGAATDIFNTPGLCLAGSGAATGTANVVEGGYIINGYWKYASGVHHATHITANCVIMQGDDVVLDDDGQPLIRPFIFDKKDVNVDSAWKFVGMMATGSDAYEINNLFVPQTRCFTIDADAAVINAPLYHYPFLQLAEVTLAANLSGMAVHFIDLCRPVFIDRIKKKTITVPQKTVIVNVLDKAASDLDDAREVFFHAVETSWQAVTINSLPDKDVMQSTSQASRTLAKTAREVVNTLYPYCGLMAANPDTELNQVWRDIHTAGQHSLLTFEV